MVLSRAPRLLKNFNRQPAPPPPVQIDDEFLRQLEDNLERADSNDGANDPPTLPDGVDLDDLNQDLDGLKLDDEAR